MYRYGQRHNSTNFVLIIPPLRCVVANLTIRCFYYLQWLSFKMAGSEKIVAMILFADADALLEEYGD